jgi:hypothetical protein
MKIKTVCLILLSMRMSFGIPENIIQSLSEKNLKFYVPIIDKVMDEHFKGYQLIRVLGAGMNGVVFEAESLKNSADKIAIKVLKEISDEFPVFKMSEELRKIADNVECVNTPKKNVPLTFKESHYCVSEMNVAIGDLTEDYKDRINSKKVQITEESGDKCGDKKEKITLSSVMMIESVVGGVISLNLQGFLHGDLKLANILLMYDTKIGYSVKLTDFDRTIDLNSEETKENENKTIKFWIDLERENLEKIINDICKKYIPGPTEVKDIPLIMETVEEHFKEMIRRYIEEKEEELKI